MHANHNPKVLWYCSHNRQKCGRGAGNSLTVRWQGQRRFVSPAMSPARLTHRHVPWQESHKHKLISGLVEIECATSLHWKVTSGLLKVSLIRGNDAFCHRWNTMVSSGMHVKFPKYFLKDFMQFWFVTLAGKHKDGHGKAVQKNICEDLSWAAFGRWQMFKVKAFICKQ